MIQELLTEKLRPKKFEQMILPKRIKSIFQDQQLHQNYLLFGSAGMGKTSLAYVLTKDYPTLYINCSDESSVDTVREKISKWCSTASILDGENQIKAIILDEFDGVSDQFFKALRGTIEKYAHVARFVATCNYLSKIPEPIQSRFTAINFDPLDKTEENEILEEYNKRVKIIFDKLGIKISEEASSEFVKRNFPDMRSILNKVQSFKIQGITEIKIDDIKKLNYSFVDIYELVVKNGDPKDNYQYLVSNYSQRVEDVLFSLGNEFISYVKENTTKSDKIPFAIVAVAKYQAQRSQVIDPVISMLACVFELQSIFK